MERRNGRRTGLAFSHAGLRNPERRHPECARIAGRRLRQRRQDRRRLRSRHAQADDADLAAADQPEKLGQAVRLALQVGCVLLQHPRADGPQVGHAAADHHPRQGFRHDPRARLRHVLVPHRRRPHLLYRDQRHARSLYARRGGRSIARHSDVEHGQLAGRRKCALPRHGGQPGADGARGQGWSDSGVCPLWRGPR